VAGIITMSDVQRVPKNQTTSTSVKTVMTQNVITIGPKESLYDALRKMTTNSVGRLPVVDPGTQKLLGIITLIDLVRAYDKTVKESP
jgi:chloride channel protein, CIC family